MKRKGFYVLTLAAMLGIVAGCGKDTTEDISGTKQDASVTEVTTPTETPAATAAPEPTATPAPTATPVPKNYMEKNGIEILGEGSYIRKGFIANEMDENGDWIMELADCEYSFDVVNVEQEGGTKIIRVTVNRSPYVHKDGGCSLFVMGGFVDLKTGKAFSPYPDELHTTLLKQGEESFEVQFDMKKEYPSVTHPYYTERYTLVCPSDYEDAGFYITGWDLSKEPYIERLDTWRMLNFIRHGESDMVVFGVNKGLETIPEKKSVDGALLAEENCFEANGLTTRGEGRITYLGTEALQRLNSETGLWELVSVETKEVETEFSVTEELLGDGTKQIKGSFMFKDEMTENEYRGISCKIGVVDKRTGLVYPTRTYNVAEPYLLEKDGEQLSILVGREIFEKEDGSAGVTISVVCPEDYDDAVFFLTGNYMTEEVDYSKKVDVCSIRDLEHGETDLLFFR